MHYSYIKDNLDNNIPSSLRVLRAVVDSLHKKIQKLENAIATQVDYCRSPCVVSCNIPVVSGKGTHPTIMTSLLPFISLCKLIDPLTQHQSSLVASSILKKYMLQGLCKVEVIHL